MSRKEPGSTGKVRVGLLFGGRSGEHEVSIASALSVYKFLDPAKYDVTLIAIDPTGRWVLPDPAPLLAQAANPMHVRIAESKEDFSVVPYPNKTQLASLAPSSPTQIPRVDVIFPVLHGTYGEDGTVQGLLELAQIPYVGSGVLGSALGMDKEVSRRLLSTAGIATVPTLCLRHYEYQAASEAVEARIYKEFALPVFIKPANAGSSVGVHKVKKADDLAPALRDAFAFDSKVLVEKAVSARELEISVLGNDHPKVSVVGEAIPHHEFYSYEAKYLDENGVSFRIPAQDVPEAILAQINTWAILAFRTLECRGMARVDFFLDRDSGKLYLNEINTIPGFTSVSMYPKMWEASGLSYAHLLDELIQLALQNHQMRRALKTSYDRP